MTGATKCEYCGRYYTECSVGCKYETQHKTADLAERIVHEIEEDVRCRRGLRQEWDQIDGDVQAEIRIEWAHIVRQELFEWANQ